MDLSLLSFLYPNIISFILGLLTGIFTHLFYRWIDEKRTRKKLVKALLEELQTDYEILERQLKTIEQLNTHGPSAHINVEKLFSTYHAESFHTMRNTDPKLYSIITSKLKSVIDAYQNLFLLNELRNEILHLTLLRDRPFWFVTLVNLKENLGQLLNNTRYLIKSSIESLENLDVAT